MSLDDVVRCSLGRRLIIDQRMSAVPDFVRIFDALVRGGEEAAVWTLERHFTQRLAVFRLRVRGNVDASSSSSPFHVIFLDTKIRPQMLMVDANCVAQFWRLLLGALEITRPNVPRTFTRLMTIAERGPALHRNTLQAGLWTNEASAYVLAVFNEDTINILNDQLEEEEEEGGGGDDNAEDDDDDDDDDYDTSEASLEHSEAPPYRAPRVRLRSIWHPLAARLRSYQSTVFRVLFRRAYSLRLCGMLISDMAPPPPSDGTTALTNLFTGDTLSSRRRPLRRGDYISPDDVSLRHVHTLDELAQCCSSSSSEEAGLLRVTSLVRNDDSIASVFNLAPGADAMPIARAALTLSRAAQSTDACARQLMTALRRVADLLDRFQCHSRASVVARRRLLPYLEFQANYAEQLARRLGSPAQRVACASLRGRMGDDTLVAVFFSPQLRAKLPSALELVTSVRASLPHLHDGHDFVVVWAPSSSEDIALLIAQRDWQLLSRGEMLRFVASKNRPRDVYRWGPALVDALCQRSSNELRSTALCALAGFLGHSSLVYAAPRSFVDQADDIIARLERLMRLVVATPPDRARSLTLAVALALNNGETSALWRVLAIALAPRCSDIRLSRQLMAEWGGGDGECDARDSSTAHWRLLDALIDAGASLETIANNLIVVVDGNDIHGVLPLGISRTERTLDGWEKFSRGDESLLSCFVIALETLLSTGQKHRSSETSLRRAWTLSASVLSREKMPIDGTPPPLYAANSSIMPLARSALASASTTSDESDASTLLRDDDWSCVRPFADSMPYLLESLANIYAHSGGVRPANS